jgi:hypothetical protein
VIHDVMLNGETGTPGLQFRCKVLGVVIEYECTGTINATTTNGSTGVTASLVAGEKLNCPTGGKEGFLEGTQTIESSKGKLEVIT